MRILVIGGTGFIGRRFLPKLVEAGHEVAIVSRGRSAAPADVHLIVCDRNRLHESVGALRAFAPEIVVDMVLSSGAQARKLMAVFGGLARRIVGLSSMDVYRACAILHRLEPGSLESVPLREESDLRSAPAYPPEQIQSLKNVFGWLDDDYDKVSVERALFGDPTLPATVLRLPMIYGPGDPLHRLFSLIKRMADGRRTIALEEPLARWRGPRGFVDNVAAAIALAVTDDRAAGRVYNVAERDNLTELELARLVASAMGWSGDFVILPTERFPPHLRFPGNLEQHWAVDSSRIRGELGYDEPFAPPDWIRDTVRWEEQNPPSAIDPKQFDYPAEDALIAGWSR